MDINVQNFLNSITDPTQRADAELFFNTLIAQGRGLEYAFQGVRTAFGSMTSAARQFSDDLTDNLDLAKAIASELTTYDTNIKRATRAMSGLVSIGQQLVDEERELNAIDEKRLKRLATEAKTKLKSLQDEARRIAGNLGVDAKMQQNATTLATLNNILNQGYDRAVAKRKKEIEAQQAILSGYKEQEHSYEAIQKAAEKRYKLEQATTKTFGLTGAALSAASSIASKFGMSHVQDQLEDINLKLREEMRKEIELNGDKALGFGRRFVYAGKAIGQTVGVLAKGMLDPLFIIGKIYTAFLDVNKAAVEYQRLTGQNAVATAGVNSSLASSVDVLTLMAEITKQTGLSATSIFSEADLGRLAEAKNLLGLSGEQATNLGLRSKLTGKSIESYQDSIVAATNKYNRLNGTAVAHGVVMQDVLNTSDEISLSLGGDAAKISAANTAARGLGLTLEKVDQIAGSILQFEDSIGKELEAELLTGKNLNLEKAREFALTGNLAGLSDELKKNGATAAEFAGMNRIEQEALAAALGMSRQELAKTVMTQENSKNLTEEQRAAAIGVSVEQMRSMDIQERIRVSLDKLAQAFAPILEALIPIAEVFLSILQPIAKVIAMMTGGVSGIVGPLATIYGIYKGIQLTMAGISVLQAGIVAMRTSELGIGGAIVTQLGFQNALAAYQLATAEGITGFALVRELLEETILGSMVLQGSAMARNLVVGAARLAQSLAIAAAELMGVSAMTLGLAVAGVVAAAAAGYGAMKSMKDGKFAKDGTPILFTGTDAVKILPNDSIYSAEDGSMKVGTDLLGEKTAKASPAIEAPQTAIITKPQELAATSQKTTTSAPATISSVASTKEDNGFKMASALQEQISVLKQILNKDTNINFDSNKANRFSTLASYKLS